MRPVGCWLRVRVSLNVATAEPSSVTCCRGWKFQSEKRYSSTTGWWKLTFEPTLTGLPGVSHGSGVPELAAVL